MNNKEDHELTSEELDHKYNQDGDGEHPVHSRREWRMRVANEDTSLGYWPWLEHALKTEELERRSGEPVPSPFEVDEANCNDQYFCVNVPSKGLSVTIKLDDEGVAVDVFPLLVADEAVVSLWATYDEINASANDAVEP